MVGSIVDVDDANDVVMLWIRGWWRALLLVNAEFFSDDGMKQNSSDEATILMLY